MVAPPIVATPLRHADWRRPSCGDRCIRIAVPLMGGVGEEVIEAHDPDHHEMYVSGALPGQLVRTGALAVDVPGMNVEVASSKVRLSPTEWRLLKILALHIGRVCSYETLIVAVWGHGGLSTGRMWRETLLRLRQRLGDAGDLIETRDGIGLVLRAEPVVETAS